MPKAYRTPDELIQIYTFNKEGLTGIQTAERLGINYYSVLSALRLLDRYVSGKVPRETKRFSNYQTAAKLIRKERSTSRLPQSLAQTEPQADHVDALKRSFEAFQQAAAIFVEAEVKRRYRALQGEIQALREENEQLKARQKTSINWIDTLEERFPKEEA